MFKILTLNSISESGTSLLAKDMFELSNDEQNPDGILLRSFDMHKMELPKSLKAVARAGAGVNNIPIDKCSESGIVVFNTPGANANAVKELVIASLLISSRKIVDGVNWAKTLENEADVEKLVEKGKGAFVGPEIQGKKLGVIGLGAVGGLVANACRALGMDVYGYDPFLSVGAAWALSRGVHRASGYDEIFEKCDYITLHIPLTADTKGLVNAESIARMKKGVRIINVSRGACVDDEAMKAALESGVVGCYVTDFPNGETLKMKNVIPIPHLGASTPESEDNCAAMAAKQIADYLQYGTIVNSVNLPECDLPYAGLKRICIIHRNVPNVIGPISTALASKHINIENMINKSKGNYACTLIDISDDELHGCEETLRELTDVISVRVI